jgi:hypothetical protein
MLLEAPGELLDITEIRLPSAPLPKFRSSDFTHRKIFQQFRNAVHAFFQTTARLAMKQTAQTGHIM